MRDQKEICRLCRRYDANTISLVDGDRIKGITMRQKLKILCQIEISSQDQLPTEVCPLCVWNLNLSFKFVSQVRDSQDWFSRSLVKEAEKSPERALPPPPMDNFGMDDVRDLPSPQNDTMDMGEAFEDEQNLDTLPEPPKNQLQMTLKLKIPKKYPKYKRKRKYICAVCGKGWICKNSLQNHLHTHFKIEREKPFQCDKCEKRYASQSLLKNHIEISHLGVRKYICEICGQKFGTEGTMRSHNRVVHCGEKPFKCKVCSRAFSRLGNCKTHERTHDKTDKAIRYACDMCDRSYSAPSNLAAHRKIHTCGRQYKCELCEQKFVSRAGLNDHFRTHTGEKPFQCPFCDMSFAQRNSMRCHIKTHPQARTFPCPVCKKKYLREDVLRDHIEKFHRT